ncbi:MAG: hypothetical protein ACRYF3_07695 [Janthinobacterium lividum]
MFEELDDPTPDLRPNQSLPSVRARGRQLKRRRRLGAAAGAGSAVAVVAALVLTLHGGGSSQSVTTRLSPAAPPTASAPATVPSPQQTSASPPLTSSSAPSSTSGSTSGSAPAPGILVTPSSVPAKPPLDLPKDVLLPAADLAVPAPPRTESEGVVQWRLPEVCSPSTPTAATAMLTLTQGDGEEEQPVAGQQIAVFPDANAAHVEAQRLATLLADDCTDGEASQGRYVAEPVAIGADGQGLVTEYYGVTATDPSTDGLGSYLVITRRGTAVTLVSSEGGELSISVSRTEVQKQAQLAWERLCRYAENGCG